jgi:hypothetical protein
MAQYRKNLLWKRIEKLSIKRYLNSPIQCGGARGVGWESITPKPRNQIKIPTYSFFQGN